MVFLSFTEVSVCLHFWFIFSWTLWNSLKIVIIFVYIYLLTHLFQHPLSKYTEVTGLYKLHLSQHKITLWKTNPHHVTYSTLLMISFNPVFTQWFRMYGKNLYQHYLRREKSDESFTIDEFVLPDTSGAVVISILTIITYKGYHCVHSFKYKHLFSKEKQNGLKFAEQTRN